MQKRLTFLLILIVLTISAWLSACGGGSPSGKGVLTYNIDRPNPMPDAAHPECLYDESSFRLTPGGVTVRSCVDVPAEALAAIERGIAHQIRNSSHYNPDWVGARNLWEYQVFLVPQMAVNQETDPGSPALLVKYLTVNSTVGGPIQTAGTCIGVDGSIFVPGTGPIGDSRFPSEILAEQSQQNWSHLAYLEEASRNESEHRAEWDNNKAMFRTFAIVGDVHPHFEDWAEANSMINIMRAAHTIKIAVDRSKVKCLSINGVKICQPAGVPVQ
jgi:hypothetical protein